MGIIMLQTIIFRKKEDTYEFLLLKRTPINGGFWQPVAGKMEANDQSKIAGCKREIQEETGISQDKILRFIEHVHYYTYNNHYLTNEPIPLVEEFVFGAEIKPYMKININNNPDNEHETYCWVNYADALAMLKWENNKIAFQKLYTLLTSSKPF